MTPPVPESPILIPLIQRRDELLRLALALQQQAAGIDAAIELIRTSGQNRGLSEVEDQS